MVVIQFINNHDGIDIAERYESNGVKAHGLVSLGNQFRFISTKETNYILREYPYKDTSDDHGYSDEVERLAQHKVKGLVITTPNLDGTERLDSTTYTRQEEIIYL